MKIRIADRLLVALSGLILILFALCLVDQNMVNFGLVTMLRSLMEKPDHAMYIAVQIAMIALLVLLGLYCLGMLFRHQKRHKRGFVVQQTDCGELSISVKAIEGLVQKCVDRHDEISVLSTALDSARDGLVIKLRIGLTGGVNIPLAVSALQKQIKQYVSSCSGVDVKEVKVQVETSAPKGKASPFQVEELPEKAAPLPVVEDKTPAITAASVEEKAAEEKKRPLHQRLFGRGEEPMTVAAPPAPAELQEQETVAAEPAPAEETPAEVSAEAPAVEADVEAPADADAMPVQTDDVPVTQDEQEASEHEDAE